MEAERIINEVKYNLLSSRFYSKRQWISSSCIINHSNIEMRNLFCFYDLSSTSPFFRLAG